MTDWSGREYAEVSDLQRTMINQTLSALSFPSDALVLDIGCGDGFLTRAIAELVPDGGAVGADVSPRMVAAAHASPATNSGPWYVIADAGRLPFSDVFDAAVSFNALHWVPDQGEALRQIATVLKPGGRATIQLVCAGERPSLEAVELELCTSPRWADWFDGFAAPFVHVAPARFAELAGAAGLTVDEVAVVDHDWDFGSRAAFERWAAVGSTAWTDRLPEAERSRFVGEAITAYEPIGGGPGRFRFTQLRAELHR